MIFLFKNRIPLYNCQLMECLGILLMLVFCFTLGIPLDMIRRVYHYRAKKLEKQKQEDEGYAIESDCFQGECWLIYKENGKEAIVDLWYPSLIFHQVQIWPDRTTHWTKPDRIELTEKEHERIFKRVMDHLAIEWKVLIEKGLY
jgi:hypothetical protein